METIENYINGKFFKPDPSQMMEVIEPATGTAYARIPVSGAAVVDEAVQAATRAFGRWSDHSPEIRSEWMLKIAAAIEDRSEALAVAETRDTGKPVALARSMDIPRAVSNFRFFATAILHESYPMHRTDNHTINYTNRHPLGVVGCISPWNLPLYLLSWKIAPALATGNCVIAKPSEFTPMTAYLLAEICSEIGLPDGVLNIIFGPGIPTGEAIVHHPDVAAISFTGGTVTGGKIATAAAPMFKKLSLEMGGKNPNIIFDDCDFSAALENTMRSSFTNQGEICLCGSRVLIQEGIYEKFKQELVLRCLHLKPDDPMDPESKIGALISEAHMNKVLKYIDLAVADGGTILTGGKRVTLSGRCSQGYYIEPTIIDGLPNTCRVNQEEIFGPVISLIPFKDEQEAVAMANDIEYGLSASVWTRDLDRAHRVSGSLKCGVVWVNCWLVRDLRTAFGGMKKSGLGREGGEEALRFFTETQNVCIRW